MKDKISKGAVAAFVILFLIAAGVGFFEWGLMTQTNEIATIHDLSREDIANCSTGERVLIHGIIESERVVVISGEYGNSYWHGEVCPFSIADESGTIEVVTREKWLRDHAIEVFSEPHYNDEGEGQFHRGDDVWAVGTIETHERGNVLVLEAISGTEDGFGYPWSSLGVMTVLLLVNGALIAFLIMSFHEFRPSGDEDAPSFWINSSELNFELSMPFGIGFILGTLPTAYASLIWFPWIYPSAFYWFIGTLLLIAAYKYNQAVQNGAMYRYWLSIKKHSDFERMITIVRRKMSHEHVEFTEKVTGTNARRPTAYEFTLTNHEVTFKVRFNAVKSSKWILFDIAPINFYNIDNVLPMIRDIIEDSATDAEIELKKVP